MRLWTRSVRRRFKSLRYTLSPISSGTVRGYSAVEAEMSAALSLFRRGVTAHGGPWRAFAV
jgi:hypothetical protein